MWNFNTRFVVVTMNVQVDTMQRGFSSRTGLGSQRGFGGRVGLRLPLMTRRTWVQHVSHSVASSSYYGNADTGCVSAEVD